MGLGVKPLKVLNDVLEVAIGKLENGPVSVEYGTKGGDDVTAASGTIVVEASNSGVDWYPLKITKNDKTDVDTLVAAGIGYVENTSWEHVRVRLSVAGGAQGVKVYAGQRDD